MIKSIIIIDDHPLIIEGIKIILTKSDCFQIVAAVHTWENLQLKLSQSFDILILDLNVNGQNLLNEIEYIRRFQPNIKILIFTSYNSPTMVKKAFDLKVDGFLLKDAAHDELVQALETITNNKIYIGKSVAKLKQYEPKKVISDQFLEKENLSKRELEIAQLLAQGFDNETIAKQLFISSHTVHTHRKRIFKKLDIHSIIELMKIFG